MSRQNPHTNVTVDGTLTGAKSYHVKINLAVRELWGQNTVPDDFVVEGEELSPMLGMVVEDGEYVLRYSLDNRDSKFNRRVVSGRLRAA